MKLWIFALVQSIIATLGLAAFFVADNAILATSAAVLAASLGIAQPLISAHKGRKLKIYQEQQWNRSVDAVDDQVNELLKDVIDPPFPHRATVAAAMKHRFADRAEGWIERYDGIVQSIEAGSPDAELLALQFADEVKPWALGPYLRGLAAWRAGNTDGAGQRFCTAKDRQSNWILPWLAWATTAYQQGRFNEIRKHHPHVCGVDLVPYDAGDETTFLELTDDERDELTNLFQQAATSLGNYYTIAEFSHSKQQMAASHEEYSKVA